MSVRAHTEQDGHCGGATHARAEDWSSRRRNVRSLIYWTFLHISAHSSAPHTQGARHKRQSSRSQRAQPDRSKFQNSNVTAAAGCDIISVCRRFDQRTPRRMERKLCWTYSWFFICFASDMVSASFPHWDCHLVRCILQQRTANISSLYNIKHYLSFILWVMSLENLLKRGKCRRTRLLTFWERMVKDADI